MPEIEKLERDEFFNHFPVSHETAARLDRYVELLTEWNKKFNLIADSTIPHIWRRHFLDCAQLIKHIPKEAKTLADLGSGAGFPGLVLGILGFPQVHLIESIGKKAHFLRSAVADLKLAVDVHQVRVESMYGIMFDVITARALKPLPQLLKLAKPLMKKESSCFFLKGGKLDDELTESGKYWKFAFETFPSLSDSSGRVLKISNLEQTGSERHGAHSKSR